MKNTSNHSWIRNRLSFCKQETIPFLLNKLMRQRLRAKALRKCQLLSNTTWTFVRRSSSKQTGGRSKNKIVLFWSLRRIWYKMVRMELRHILIKFKILLVQSFKSHQIVMTLSMSKSLKWVPIIHIIPLLLKRALKIDLVNWKIESKLCF